MSKHRRTKSNGEALISHVEFLTIETPKSNETIAILQQIQQKQITEQIVEKLELENSQGSMFHFGKTKQKNIIDLNLSAISETSSSHSTVEQPKKHKISQQIQFVQHRHTRSENEHTLHFPSRLAKHEY